MSNTSIVLTPSEFNFDKLSFSIQTKSFEVNKSKMQYYSIVLRYNKQTDFYVKLPKMFSFGISTSTFESTSKPKLSTSFVLKDRDGATPEQQEFIDFLDKLVEKTKKWMVENRLELGTPSLGENMLETLSPVWIKKDKNGIVVDGAIPTLNANIKQKFEKIVTDFYEEGTDGEDDRPIDPLTFLNTETSKKFYTMVDGAASFPDVYYSKGKSAKLHCVLEEATVQTRKERTERLTGKGGKRSTLYQPSVVAASVDDDEDVDNSTKVESAKLETKKAVEPEPVNTTTPVKSTKKSATKKIVKEESESEDDDESSSEDEIPKNVMKTTKGGLPRRN